MVICTECGRENQPGSRYCSNCGESLENAPKIVPEGKPVDEQKPKKNFWPIILPISVLAVMIGIVIYTYEHTKQVNVQVDAQNAKAEELALQGKYKQAEKELEKAQEKRPDYLAVEQNLDSLHKVMKLDEKLNKVSKAIEQNELNKAEQELTSVSGQMREDKNRLIVTLTPRVNQLDSLLTVGKINYEVKEMTNVEALADKLNTLSGLNLDEASRSREKIIEKIVSISTKKAEEAMKEKKYNEAMANVDEGLQYAVNHQHLSGLKERIRQEQQAFEQVKQERIQRAMEQAEAEELKNHEDAVKIEKMEVNKDEFGDVTVSGIVKSEATKIVSSIEITYDLINENKEVLTTETAQVYPMYLNPGDTGNLEMMHYDMEEENLEVEVKNVQWFVE
ncbi:zinc ribbon domain-containing protein [Halobacillus massiliensis]|uniref:zinc ribbon domain-containing protein n=1 Tax=Halobacillus massiliensis TaxID=1926286 RepID=UPI0009E1CCDA|nr:zinc ribbon domain-containing protein [Halobacillus massiliensis]